MNENTDVPIVVADFIMPGMTGDVLLEKVHNLLPNTRTILLTGQASIEGIGNAINHGNLYRFISQPWEKDDLMLTLREALQSYDQEATIVITSYSIHYTKLYDVFLLNCFQRSGF